MPISLATSIFVVLVSTTELRAATFAAQVDVSGVDNATTVATVLHQSAGATLEVSTMPGLNRGDLSLLVGGLPMTQAGGVIIANPNQFQYASVSNRNIVELPGEVTGATPTGFPAGMWLSTTSVAGGGAEANFRLSLVQFPFSDGWTAGHVDSGGALLTGNTTGVTVTHLPMLPVAAFGDGHYQLSIAGINSLTDGMLFGVSDQNDTSGNAWQAGVLPDGSGWDIRINDQGVQFPATEQGPWSFVYVPYTAQNLVAAGQLSLTGGTTITVLSSVGTFTASRVDIGNSAANSSIIPPAGVPEFPDGGPDTVTDVGRFLIQIPGKDDTTGVLMVGISKFAASGGNFGADDNILVYEYNTELGGFLVETYDLPGANLQDSDIYFAYVDFNSPLSLLMPDVNMDGVVNIFDINLVSSNWNGPGPAGDANKDGIVNIFDINLISANWTPAAQPGRLRHAG